MTDVNPRLSRLAAIPSVPLVLLVLLALSLFAPCDVDARPRKKKVRPARQVMQPVIPEDPAVSAGKILESNMDAFFKARRPLYGSFVALEPDTGRVIAVSSFTNGGKVKDPAVTATFPAASIFKVISAAALIEKGVGVEEKVCYTGGRRNITASNLLNRKRERSCRSFSSAFAHSTNAVFAKLADRHLTADRLIEMARRFGFGKTIKVGDVATMSAVRRPEGRVGLARMAAGFAGSNLSALHGAVIGAIIANGGSWPSEVHVQDSGGPESQQVISPETARAIGKMMTRTVTGGTGTKHLAVIKALSGSYPAVKTGTLTSRDGSGVWNNWIVGYYPSNKPEIAFAVHIGNSWAGGLRAGQAAAFAMKTWLKVRNRKAPSH
ncbi:MAG TPA: penicillin-binding transpeptidase domain-containing protein [Myxococcota bacterium]|nr:penicillin-binding transpeptidase domain-containing protein [Myxococcota bacterium]HPV03314.1 penicillin-binding transpeptidase domain-containing protein [Myxococcota bacterium]